MKRSILKTLISACCLLSLAAAPAIASLDKKISPAEALQLLKEGNVRFVSGKSTHPHTDSARLQQANKENQGEHAYATVITCSDSRVPVERLFDAGIMNIFVIRVAGNVVGVDEAGSIEYGIAHVHTPVVVFLGHTQCGAVTAATQAALGHGHDLEVNIPPIIKHITPAVKKAIERHPKSEGNEIIPHAIVANVWHGIYELFMQSPTARELSKSGKVKIVGAIYDVGTGMVKWLPEDKTKEILEEVEKEHPEREMHKMANQHEH